MTYRERHNTHVDAKRQMERKEDFWDSRESFWQRNKKEWGKTNHGGPVRADDCRGGWTTRALRGQRLRWRAGQSHTRLHLTTFVLPYVSHHTRRIYVRFTPSCSSTRRSRSCTYYPAVTTPECVTAEQLAGC